MASCLLNSPIDEEYKLLYAFPCFKLNEKQNTVKEIAIMVEKIFIGLQKPSDRGQVIFAKEYPWLLSRFKTT